MQSPKQPMITTPAMRLSMRSVWELVECWACGFVFSEACVCCDLFLVQASVDLRCGMDRLLVWVQRSGGVASGSVGYVFRNRAGSRIKLLLIDGTGVWLCVRRLHAGRFHWPRSTDDRCELSSEQFAWLCVGVDWVRLSTSVVPEHTF